MRSFVIDLSIDQCKVEISGDNVELVARIISMFDKAPMTKELLESAIYAHNNIIKKRADQKPKATEN